MAFNIDKFAETSQRVKWADLDMGEFITRPLPENTLRCLRYMCDVEYHTVCYMRDMLVTPSHQDKDVSTFMTMWNREEYWHGEALAEVLGLHGIVVDYDELKAKRMKLGWSESLKPLKQSLLSNMVGADFIATHMAWGAANEWSAVAAYRRLADLEKHPVLAVLLKRIAAQERHDHAAALDAKGRGIHHIGAGDQAIDQAFEEDRLRDLPGDPPSDMRVVSGTDFRGLGRRCRGSGIGLSHRPFQRLHDVGTLHGLTSVLAAMTAALIMSGCRRVVGRACVFAATAPRSILGLL